MTEPADVSQHTDTDGVVHVVFDRPGDPVNLLTAEILRYLDRLFDDIAAREGTRGILLRSAKPGCFLAGMDVDEIAAITDASVAADGARLGQAVFQKLAALPVPSVCAIGGTCLGGGTELALACTYRLASDDPGLQIGLPEVRLGIVPGFGGTQRLPRQVGLVHALDLILTGRHVNGRRGKRIGLVDEVVPAAYLEREALATLHRAQGRARRGTRRTPLPMALIEKIGPARQWVLRKARRKTEARIRASDYPAPFKAIEAIEAAYAQPLPQGLDTEARIVGELVPSETSKHLIWLFKTQTALKKDSGGIPAVPRKVRRAGVVGAGIMGGGIAQLLADRSIPVRLKDIRQDAILTALRAAREVWDRKLSRGRMSPRQVRSRMGYIAPTLDDSGLARVDLVVEAVVEDLEIKQAVLADLERRMDERAVFASNTSSLPISDISAKALHPERVVGLHFFNPVHRMPLVEIIPGQRTSPEAVATVHALAVKLGKTPVVVRDAPGFLVNRILMLYLNEALRLLAEGVRVEDADRAMVAFGMPVGPFRLLDEVGLDTANHVAHVLHGAFGRRIGGHTPALGDMVDAGYLGRKNGKGFYRYRNGDPGGSDPAVYRIAKAEGRRELPPETLQERMVLAMANEAAVCLEDGVAREPRDVDIAMVMGTGFPPFRGGLLHHADRIGIAVMVDRLSRLADAHGERYRPAELLREMVRAERRFF